MGVVDEVQMIEDQDRGGAWTRAILGESESTHTQHSCCCFIAWVQILCVQTPPITYSTYLCNVRLTVCVRARVLCVRRCSVVVQVCQRKRFISVAMRVPYLWSVA